MAIAVGLIALLLILLVGGYTLSAGAWPTALNDVLSALAGKAERRTQMLVVEWGLPRLLFAICCGVALRISGALFQSLTRNPLGSPDILGFAAGSYTGALVVMFVLGTVGYYAVAGGTARRRAGGGARLPAGLPWWHRGIQADHHRRQRGARPTPT